MTVSHTTCLALRRRLVRDSVHFYRSRVTPAERRASNWHEGQWATLVMSIASMSLGAPSHSVAFGIAIGIPVFPSYMACVAERRLECERRNYERLQCLWRQMPLGVQLQEVEEGDIFVADILWERARAMAHVYACPEVEGVDLSYVSADDWESVREVIDEQDAVCGREIFISEEK